MTDILTLAGKEIRNFFKIWKQTIVPSIMTASLYILIFGKFLGDQISAIDGVSYIHYIFPGLLMMNIIMGSYSISAFGFFSAKMFKSLEELLVSPISKNKIIIGYVLAGVTRGLVVGACIFIVSLFFIDNITVESPLLAIIFALLTSMAFSLGGLVNAIFANNFDDVNVIPNFIITPMIYLGGVFYSVSMLGEFWQTVSVFNPVLYMINGLRHAFLGVSDVNIYTSFFIVIAFIITLYIFVLKLLQKGYKIKS